MNLTIKVLEESNSVFERLKEGGADVRLVRGGILLKPDYDHASDSYVVPVEIHGMSKRLFIDCCESGGASTSTGSATICCGFRGARLRPYYEPQGGHLSNGTHAYFRIPNKVVTVKASKYEPSVEIFVHRIISFLGVFAIHRSFIWKGFTNELPYKYRYYREAALAALEKAHCYHCREPHFVQRIHDC